MSKLLVRANYEDLVLSVILIISIISRHEWQGIHARSTHSPRLCTENRRMPDFLNEPGGRTLGDDLKVEIQRGLFGKQNACIDTGLGVSYKYQRQGHVDKIDHPAMFMILLSLCNIQGNHYPSVIILIIAGAFTPNGQFRVVVMEASKRPSW
ncbi:hypothetical protein BDZ45DRAFT_751338 [Acephala macrosclerotiorum]|nr:hypothetical protein BDZ45DRAFT_751338 [Acephala macrosclerotiorum]